MSRLFAARGVADIAQIAVNLSNLLPLSISPLVKSAALLLINALLIMMIVR